MKATITKTRNRQFRFNLTGTNGEKVATSETYTRKAKALQTIKKYFPSFEGVDKTGK